MNHKQETLWLLKKYILCILCTLILFNHFHLIIASSLILIESELWVPKCYYAHFKVFSLVFRVFKSCHQDFSILHIIILVIHHFFLPKWITFSVFSPFFYMELYKWVPFAFHFFLIFICVIFFFIFIWDFFTFQKVYNFLKAYINFIFRFFSFILIFLIKDLYFLLAFHFQVLKIN
jgi:hypothetical protein